MPRKVLPYLLLAAIGGACFFTWKSLKREAPRPTAEALPTRTLRPAAQARSKPARLEFLTDIGQPYQARIIQFRNATTSGCSEPELRFLYKLLEESPPKGELPEHWFVIANDIITKILANETDPERFASNLIGLLNSPQQPDVIRDYAVQHLATWLNPRSAQASATRLATASPEIAAQVLQSLAAATIDPTLEHSTVPGTTLMMLVELNRSKSGVDCSEAIATLTPWLALALQDGSTLSNPIRVSAVSAAGILAPAEFRPLIRRIAYQENAGSSLRLPAIAALGEAGDAEDLPKLHEIAANSPDLSYAANDAAAALATRFPASH
jgi:hypothetical protein